MGFYRSNDPTIKALKEDGLHGHDDDDDRTSVVKMANQKRERESLQ